MRGKIPRIQLKMIKNRSTWLLLSPGIILFLILLVAPITNILDESLRLFEPGRIGAAKDAPYTLFNYIELIDPAYFFYLFETFRFGIICSLISLIIAFPIAYTIARQKSPLFRKLSIGFLIGMMFLNTLVRVYAMQLTFGPTGYAKFITGIFDISPNGRTYTEIIVMLGLLHYLIPISALTLIGTIQNINPRLTEAAQVLGSSRLKSHLTITVPLCIPGILSAFLICFTLCLSAFVVPMVLGKGKVLFISNLIYARFSEIANYPSGSAVSIIMLVVSLGTIFIITRFVSSRWSTK